ncbi:MAG: ABC transporter ATP-binding protein [Hyphomicrobiales bacterium]|nr:ABC transporter ATP-binding protein [Hyphomicrobiales bacterium]MBV8823705.1 ABC transporter ATP-binding protein [Hyphomicrobiales bacterium]
MADEVEIRQETDRGGAKLGFAPWADPAARPLVRFDAVTKRFGETRAVDALSLDIFPGEFFALLGPSGCGKSTLLRLLAGFEAPSEGRVLLDGTAIDAVPPHRRPVNMMFQNYALFPHLTVEGNVAFGLKQEGRPRAEIAARVAEMLALVKLAPLARRKPHELSGGQRQRVALARSLVKRPRVLLLDEPLAALDKQLRGETQFELMELQARLGTTFVIVTHDQEEAMTVAHRMGVMDRGRIVQVGTPAEVYEQPNSRYVASFVGDVNLIEGRLAAVGPSGLLIDSTVGAKLATNQRVEADVGATVWVTLRPEKLRVATAPPAANENCVSGHVAEIAYLGNVSLYKVRLDNGFMMKAQLPNLTRVVERPIGTNERVWLSWTPDAGVVLTG